MILDEIMKYRARQLEREKAACGLEKMQKRAEKALAERKPVSLKAALRQDTLSCICEVKKASPSKGLIRADCRFCGRIFSLMHIRFTRRLPLGQTQCC